MKNLTAVICLTIAVFLGNAGVSWSADFSLDTPLSGSEEQAQQFVESRQWVVGVNNADQKMSLSLA
jgi:hypothetical protein